MLPRELPKLAFLRIAGQRVNHSAKVTGSVVVVEDWGWSYPSYLELGGAWGGEQGELGA